MSRIDDLITKCCPEGVQSEQLDELLIYDQPSKYRVSSTSFHESHETPVVTAGKTFVLGYTDEKDGIYIASDDKPVIIFDDFTSAFKWVNFRFKVRSSAMKILAPKQSVQFSLRYVYYAMHTIDYTPQNHARQWIQTYSKFRIPFPPLGVQHEIVKVLDTFTELEAELEARRRQYKYYRDALLSFHERPLYTPASKQASKQLYPDPEEEA